MKFPLSWLNDYVEITLSTDDLCHTLTMAGLEIDSIEHTGHCIKDIFTGKIERITPHPNADKLVITSVFDGKNHHQIVTGATNISEGDIVPFAVPGSIIASGMTLKPVALRGVDSFGMLCSEKELGVSDEASGIWILDATTPLGIPFDSYALLKDTILDVAILPNRGDCQSIYGLAREISVLCGVPLKSLDCSVTYTDAPYPFSVSVNQPELCPLYIGRHVTNIQSTTTPLWMKRRLELSGLRSISFIVDVTNYVLLETGQPLHAFDTNKCTSTHFNVDCLKKDTPIHTLDDQSYNVSSSTLVIENDAPVAIAGIMGANNSDVDDTTTEIFLESAYFDAKHVRKNSTRLGLRTDSSIRFEKGINIDLVDMSSLRTCHLLQTLGNAQIIKEFSQVKSETDSRFSLRSIPFDHQQINQFLGSDFSQTAMIDVLDRLGFVVSDSSIQIPIWRNQDIQEWPCVAEEVARVIGFDHIPATLPQSFCIQEPEQPQDILTQKIKSFLVMNGFSELCTYPMISTEDFLHCEQQDPTPDQQLANPISPQLSTMRASMIASVSHIAGYHHSRQMLDLQLFEIGRIFSNTPDEKTHFSALCSGALFKHPKTSAEHTMGSDYFYFLKGHIENLFTHLNISLSFKQDAAPHWAHPEQWVQLFLGNRCIGTLALLHPQFSKYFQIHHDCCYVEFDCDSLLQHSDTATTYVPFSRFPSTRRDVAFIINKHTNFSSIDAIIKKYKHKTLIDYFVFDCFESDQLGHDQKSMAMGFIYQDPKTTLSDKKVNKIHDRLCQTLVDQIDIKIR